MEGAGGIGGLLARSDGYSSGNFTTHNYYFADGNGNVTYMLNSSQSMVASYRYDPFGNTISSSGTLADANVYRFSSKEIHANSGMYYYGYRFYDPNLQRWINRDPIKDRGFRRLRPLKKGRTYRNSYLFALTPTGTIDPLGLTVWLCTRPVDSFPYVGVHAYLWDDRDTFDDNENNPANHSCGNEGSCGHGSSGNDTSNPGDVGPDSGEPGVHCAAVPGSDGNEDAIMDNCRQHANDGMWVPGINDCHNRADKCLKDSGYTPPPHSRFPPEGLPQGPSPGDGWPYPVP